MSCGLRSPSLSASTPTTDHVDGMNWSGPTARSKRRSWSSSPASESRSRAVAPRPSRRGPKIAGLATPLPLRVEPACRPWSDSTRPRAATSSHRSPQSGSAVARTEAARWYAASARLGMSEGEPTWATATSRTSAAVGTADSGSETLAGSVGGATGSATGATAVAGLDGADGTATVCAQIPTRAVAGTRTRARRRARDNDMPLPSPDGANIRTRDDLGLHHSHEPATTFNPSSQPVTYSPPRVCPPVGPGPP